jgi:hypothetical protein
VKLREAIPHPSPPISGFWIDILYKDDMNRFSSSADFCFTTARPQIYTVRIPKWWRVAAFQLLHSLKHITDCIKVYAFHHSLYAVLVTFPGCFLAGSGHLSIVTNSHWLKPPPIPAAGQPMAAWEGKRRGAREPHGQEVH